MTDAALIVRLIEEAAHAPDWRSGYARSGRLPVFHLWDAVMYLTPDGEVVIAPEEDGPVRPADPAERDFALARAAERHPQLAHLRPPEPPHSATCGLCRGRGRLAVRQGTILPPGDGDESRSILYCPRCNSLGWTVSG